MTAPTEGRSAVSGRLTGTSGRYLLSAGTNHLVSDSRSGQPEAITAGELFMAAVASCALSNIDRHGTDLGADLTDATVRAESLRDAEDETRYREVRLTVDLPHVPAPTAREIIARFTGTCPIYNTIRRGGTIALHLEPPRLAHD
ncbi:OsmC family protein [Streptomyces radicis]|uniref:OsmC family peroxiredoxin n=1 Tax=Streptomyces radicis TaxID=1750517 RepID=A0A3A9WI64_9ACTN|nr:OsmC family protein [Streptomyces radicis]RKN07396.1 OsmC family peroxiredoxin [Streptomyces radicis]RKN19585.1 OsmC family peroxiredoxin [Streptomyces radicis]